MLKLVKPSAKYKRSFLADYLKRNEMQEEYAHIGIPKKQTSKRFAEFLKKLNLQGKGKGLPKSYVPNTVLWLVDGNKFIGKVGIRHKLTPKIRKYGGHIGYYIRPEERRKGYGTLILKLGLKKAKLLGIKNVQISCLISNKPSQKIIEANGGKFLWNGVSAEGLPGHSFQIKLK